MVSTFVIESAARADLAAIRDTDSGAFAEILALMRELQACRSLVDRLLVETPRWANSATENIDKWNRLYRAGFDLWRLKLLAPSAASKYRIVYAYDIQTYSFHVLAVVPRGAIDYDDPNHPLTKRILHDYDQF